MNNLNPATTTYLLEVSLEDLHQQSRTWLSEIEFWRIELSFYQKLLEKITVSITSVADKQRIDHFQNLILYFGGELLDQYEHDIRAHEASLDKMIEEKAPFNEKLYREKHKGYESQLRAFELDFRNYRKELFVLAEKYL